jgi:riboflavin transporter FmnP
MVNNMDAKTVSFVLMMGVLGNLLFTISYYTGNYAPGIAVDFSLVAVFIAGFYGGPISGFFSGLFAGLLPGIMFGPMGMGSWLGLIGLPFGKGLTGLTAGIFAKGFGLGKGAKSSILAVPATLLSYVPECLYTYAYFAYLMPVLLGSGGSFIFFIILPKSLAEVTIMSFLMAALIGNNGFNNFIGRFFTKSYMIPKLKAAKSD